VKANGQRPRALVKRGRALCEQRAWASAHRALSAADRQGLLAAGDDLDRLALAAYFLGRDDEYLAVLKRAYQAHLAAGAGIRAARTAFWLGLRLLFRGELGQANGWLGRGQRLLEEAAVDCVERGYLLLAVAQRHMGTGDADAAEASSAAAVEIGERYADADLVATGRHLLGLLRLQRGDVEQGLSLLDEAMIAVTGGELSPLITGLVYCSVIDGCQEVYALARAREWTAALARWCDQQPEMVAFAGICGVHRAEILKLDGAWPEALAEAERAAARCLNTNRSAAGAAFYEQGEVRRLRGDLAAAEEAYRRASEHGHEPQPGLALLRMTQGRAADAAASIRRAVGATTDRTRRTRLLPAFVEIVLAAGGADEAESACRELEAAAGHFDSHILRGLAAHARGAVELAKRDPLAASEALRRGLKVWQEMGMPYLAARARVLVARCDQALDDEDGARLELAAARTIFERLGAAPDLEQVDSIAAAPRVAARAPADRATLTAREGQVLRLVAMGKTNKAIAAALSLSEKTVERHLSNIFNKLDVPSRTAATAYAYAHGLT
jgi:DNA-binding CsgD family transcriptional regulator